MMLKSILNTVVAVCFCFVLFNCSGGTNGTNLSGKYGLNQGEEFSNTIEFSGKTFIITEYPTLVSNAFLGGSVKRNIHFYELEECIPMDTISKQMMHGANQKAIDGTLLGAEIRCKGVTKGTYSISNDKIEFVFSDGAINVQSFSRTENTIEIARERFTRMR